MFKIDLKKLSCVTLAAFVLLACGCEGYPDNATVNEEFRRLAKIRVPSEVAVVPTAIYRADGDYKSFSQIVVYEATASKEVVIKHGWLKGVLMHNGQVISGCKVEFVYYWKNDRWLLVDDGPVK
ncbi:hypothetical protein V1318_21585 [Lysobacter sp. CCNWLW3]|uniref:hypothetical protein n=1 Tax=unclassified Lysobacter TaxID=2635362 RepID=UPI002FD3D159